MTNIALDKNYVGRVALRKATWRVVPLLGLGYALATIDRLNISFAALQMNRDLHFSAAMYGFGAGLFFLSYAVCQVPCNLLLCRIGARRWLGGIMVVWGVLATAMMFVRTPDEFYAVRFVLGIAEAGFFPGVLYTLSQWFPAEVRARAVSRFYIAWPLSTVLMGLIAGALLGLQGRLGLAGWQWLFLLEGLPAVLLGAVVLWQMADSPAAATWLKADESAWLVAELAKEDAGKFTDENVLLTVLKTLGNLRVLGLGLGIFCMITCNYGYTFSGPLLLRDLTGMNATKIGYLVAAMTVLGAPAMLLVAWLSDRRKERYWHVIVPFALMSAGYFVSAVSRNEVTVIAALTVAGLSMFAMQGPIYAVVTRLFAGQKSAAAIATINTLSILGGFVGPIVMGKLKDSSGGYQQGLMFMVVAGVVGMGMFFVLWLKREETD